MSPRASPLSLERPRVAHVLGTACAGGAGSLTLLPARRLHQACHCPNPAPCSVHSQALQEGTRPSGKSFASRRLGGGQIKDLGNPNCPTLMHFREARETYPKPGWRREEGCSTGGGLNAGSRGVMVTALGCRFRNWEGTESNSHFPVVHGSFMSGEGLWLLSLEKIVPCPGTLALST